MTSSVLLILFALITSIQIFSYGFQFAILTALIARALYLSRLLGVIIPSKICMGIEGFAIFWIVIRCVIFRTNFKILQFIVYLVAIGLIVLIEFVNDSNSIYEDISEEEYNRRKMKNKILKEYNHGVTNKSRKNNNRIRKGGKHR